MTIDVVGLITARGGSKAVPQKNIKLLAGKPLIAWTIEVARQCRLLRRVIVSTDAEEIEQVARTWGAEVPFRRPEALAQDATASIEVVIHALNWLRQQANDWPTYLLLLQPTSPLRMVQDIEAIIQLAEAQQAPSVVSVCPARPHPWLGQVISAAGTLESLAPAEVGSLRRQDLPAAYALNGALYLIRSDILLQARTFVPPGTYPYIMPVERSLDIDTAWDFHLAELLLRYPYVS